MIRNSYKRTMKYLINKAITKTFTSSPKGNEFYFITHPNNDLGLNKPDIPDNEFKTIKEDVMENLFYPIESVYSIYKLESEMKNTIQSKDVCLSDKIQLLKTINLPRKLIPEIYQVLTDEEGSKRMTLEAFCCLNILIIRQGIKNCKLPKSILTDNQHHIDDFNNHNLLRKMDILMIMGHFNLFCSDLKYSVTKEFNSNYKKILKQDFPYWDHFTVISFSAYINYFFKSQFQFIMLTHFNFLKKYLKKMKADFDDLDKKVILLDFLSDYLKNYPNTWGTHNFIRELYLHQYVN